MHPHLDERIPVRAARLSPAAVACSFAATMTGRSRSLEPPWHEGRGMVVAQVTLDESGWASVVSSVSLAGETHERWQAVRDFTGAARSYDDTSRRDALAFSDESRWWKRAAGGAG